MGTDHPPRSKQGRLGEPSLWADEPGDDALSLLEENALREDEPALWGDEHTDDVHSLLEENARLRGLLVQLSDLIRRNVVQYNDALDRSSRRCSLIEAKRTSRSSASSSGNDPSPTLK
jgi:hypothetical protein